MSALEIIRAAQADGVTLNVVASLKAGSTPPVVAKWIPALRAHKTEIVKKLSEFQKLEELCIFVTKPDLNCTLPSENLSYTMQARAASAMVEDSDPAANKPALQGLSSEEYQQIEKWLDQIGEWNPRTRQEVILQAQTDMAARKYYLHFGSPPAQA